MTPYEIYAIRYATRQATRSMHFVHGDPHDTPMPMDYFVWVVRNAERTILVDTGFNEAAAKKRGRTLLRMPSAGLAMLGIERQAVAEIVITHLHYDHVGTYYDFPNARFHLQEAEMSYATGRFMTYRQFAPSFEPDEICGMVRCVFDGRVNFIDGEATLAPGISLPISPDWESRRSVTSMASTCRTSTPGRNTVRGSAAASCHSVARTGLMWTNVLSASSSCS